MGGRKSRICPLASSRVNLRPGEFFNTISIWLIRIWFKSGGAGVQ